MLTLLLATFLTEKTSNKIRIFRLYERLCAFFRLTCLMYVIRYIQQSDASYTFLTKITGKLSLHNTMIPDKF